MGANSSNTTAAQAQKDLGLAVLQDTYAALDHDELQGHEERLREAANHLWEAYCMGVKEPAVVWPLKQLWTDTGHLARVIELLKDYIEASDNPEERFLAGHYVVDTYALMKADELAVEHHRRYMAELYQRNAANLCHSLAFKLIWSGRPEDSIALFERALSYRENPITRFFYAGVLMQVRGDREAALDNLRKAASDPRSSLVHRFEEAFRENSSFASVHNDPESLTIVRQGAARYKAVGGL